MANRRFTGTSLSTVLMLRLLADPAGMVEGAVLMPFVDSGASAPIWA